MQPLPPPALPAKFTRGLKNEETTEGTTVTLHCELSKEAPVEWRKGSETLTRNDRVSLRQDGTLCELQIHSLTVEDAGEYSCVCGQERTSATLTIRGKDTCDQEELCFGVLLLASCHPPVCPTPIMFPTFHADTLSS